MPITTYSEATAWLKAKGGAHSLQRASDGYDSVTVYVGRLSRTALFDTALIGPARDEAIAHAMASACEQLRQALGG